MSKNNKEGQHENAWERMDDAVIESEHFLERYQKQILIGLAVFVLVVCAYLAYTQLYQAPKNVEAQVAMYKGQEYFEAHQDSLAIYGDGNDFIGFEAIMNTYGSTKAGELAKLYTGLSLARLGKYDEALTRLKDYSGSDLIISHAVNSTIGDCLVATGKKEQAPDYFVKAAKGVDNEMQSPIFYKKAIELYRELGNHAKVIELCTIVENNYGRSRVVEDAKRYMEEAKILQAAK